MSDKRREEELNQERSGDSPPNRDIAGSPGSHTSNSSSSRQQRIVELLQDQAEDESQQLDWTISREFYEEDVAQNSENMSAEETDEEGEDDDDEPSMNIDLINQDESELDEDDEDEDDDVSTDEDARLYIFHDVHEIEDIMPAEQGVDDVIEGFVVEYENQSSTDDDDDELDEDDANYDTSLPAVHSYLGDNLDECRGRQVLVEGSITSMPLFNLKHVVLLPGQTLPITSSNLNFRIEMSLKSCIRLGRTTIGLMSSPSINPVGTTAEIRNASIQDDMVRIIVEGRQRFKLLSPPFESVIEGQIRILPEVILGHPYPKIPSLSRFFTNKDIPNKFIISKHPIWILKRYEARYVMARILDQIKDWCSSDLTRNPNDFSYWVAANLPISNEERMKALNLNCTEARLIWVLDMLERSEYFGCAACKNVICFKSDVFPMSRSGPQCSFVNSGGYIHDTLTVRSAQGLIQEYGWQKEYCWFPGYVWRMAHCNQCNRHIGWCYKRIEAETKPKKFYGLSRANVRLQSAPKEQEQRTGSSSLAGDNSRAEAGDNLFRREFIF